MILRNFLVIAPESGQLEVSAENDGQQSTDQIGSLLKGAAFSVESPLRLNPQIVPHVLKRVKRQS